MTGDLSHRNQLITHINQFGPDHATRRDHLRDLIAEKCMRHGDLTLASGIKSNWLVNLKIATCSPLIAPLLGHVAACEFQQHFPDVDLIGAVPVGGFALSSPLIIFSQYTGGREVTMFDARDDEPKSDANPFSTFDATKPIVMVEDTITTGSSSLPIARRLRKFGANIVGMYALIDRDEGATEAFAAEGIPVRSTYKGRDFVPQVH